MNSMHKRQQQNYQPNLSNDLLPAYSENRFSEDAMAKLNQLIGYALIDQNIYIRLVVERDPTLCSEFGIAPEVWQVIVLIQATNLQELCTAILASQQINRYH